MKIKGFLSSKARVSTICEFFIYWNKGTHKFLKLLGDSINPNKLIQSRTVDTQTK